MIRAKVIGAGGYGGVGIVELLLRHPEARIVALVAKTETGMRMSELYPHLQGACDLTIHPPEAPEAQAEADVVFFSTPDRVGMGSAEAELARGARVIDYSGDFRFRDPAVYAEYARRLGKPEHHDSPHLLPDTVYGLAELHRNEISTDRRLVGNPGCFAVSMLLGLAPAVREELIDPASIICDGKTAVSGAGKKPAPNFHYPARYDQMNAYRLTGHQHVCEVEQELGALAGTEVRITFTAQVVPACRGILSTLYGTLRDGVTADRVQEIYRDFADANPFVRLLDHESAGGTQYVRGTNVCSLLPTVDERTRRLRLVSHIDNLVKGQAGNALQNMNLLFGLPETTGLDQPGQFP